MAAPLLLYSFLPPAASAPPSSTHKPLSGGSCLAAKPSRTCLCNLELQPLGLRWGCTKGDAPVSPPCATLWGGSIFPSSPLFHPTDLGSQEHVAGDACLTMQAEHTQTRAGTQTHTKLSLQRTADGMIH